MVELKVTIRISIVQGVKSASLIKYRLNHRDYDVPRKFQDMSAYHHDLLSDSNVMSGIAANSTQWTGVVKITPTIASKYAEKKFVQQDNDEDTSDEEVDFRVEQVNGNSDSSQRSPVATQENGNREDDPTESTERALAEALRRIQMLERQQRNQQLNHQMSQSSRQEQHFKLQLPKFDHNKQNPSQFVKSFNNICAINGYHDDNFRINAFALCFAPGSEPMSWYQTRMEDDADEDWQSWEEDFIESFRVNRIQAYYDATNYRYSRGPLSTYYHEKRRLLKIAFPFADQHTLITLMLVGLPEVMQDNLNDRREIETLKDLRKAMLTLKPLSEKKEKSNERPELPKQSKFFKRHFAREENRAKPNYTTQPTPASTNAKSAPKKKVNLVASDSDMQVRNVYSNCVGHLDPSVPIRDVTSNCVSRSANESPDILKVDASVNDVDTQILLDTGSQVDLIRPDLVDKLNLVPQKPHEYVRITCANNTKNILTQVVDVNIKVGNYSSSYRPYIFNDLAFNYIVKCSSLPELGWIIHHVDKPCKPSCNSIKVANHPVRSIDDVTRFYPACLKPPLDPAIKVPFQLKPGHKVVARKPYRLSPDKMEWARKKVDELLARNIIRPSTSRFATPIVLPPKENGELRFCMDYRAINQETDLDPFPFPIIDDLIAKFGGCLFFSKIDLADGYWQIGLTEETKQFTAFVLPFGHFEMNRLPFGWKNSGAIFQRIMSETIAELNHHPRVGYYIDDVICGGTTEEECAFITGQVIAKLAAAGFTLNLKKCTFGQKSVKLLGRVIDGVTKTTREESVQKVRSMAQPFDLHTLRQFTGLTNHFRAFIRDYAAVVRPLDQLKKKDAPWTWTRECQDSFDRLKLLITSEPILQLPDWKLNFELCTDASNLGCGSVLYQRDPIAPKPRQLRVIGYQSYTFNKAEQNYHVTEKEGLAVVKAIKYFRSYLEGRKIIVHTDHQSVLSILNEKEPKGRLGRWVTFLMGFNIQINHRSGKELTDADAMSRLCIGQEAINCSMTYGVMTPELSQAKIQEILKQYHDDPHSGAHDGFSRTYLKIKDRFKWPNMHTEIKQYVKSCPICQNAKAKFRARPDIMFLPKHSSVPFEVLHIDHAEIQKKKEGVKSTQSFLVVIDECTRYTWAKSMKEASKPLIDFFKSFAHLDKVKTIISDNGRAFISADFVNWCKERGITTKTVAPYNPQANGLVERRIRDIKLYLALYPMQVGGWKVTLQMAVKHLNRSYHSSLGCSPHFKAFGKADPFPADHYFQVATPEEHPFSKEQVLKLRERIQENYNRRHSSNVPNFQAGQDILVQGDKRKPHEGPFTIKDVKKKNEIPKTIIYFDPSRGDLVAPARNCLPYYQRACDSWQKNTSRTM